MALSFFKRNKKDMKRQGGDSAVSSEEILGEEVQQSENAEEEVYTQLSIHPKWKVKDEDLYVYRFLNNELPPLKPNQLSLSGIELEQKPDQVRVTAFIRSTVVKPIELNDASLILLDENDQQLGKKTFQLKSLGQLPVNSSRPWHFIFNRSELDKEEIPAEGWKLAFELKPGKHRLDLDENWEKSLSEEDKDKLKEMVDNLTPPKEGEVNFMGLQANVVENGNLHVTMLIRNGGDKEIQLHELPLHVEDATGEVIATGGFKLDDFKVKANTTKPWTFIFPKELVKKDSLDLSKWKAYPPQQ